MRGPFGWWRARQDRIEASREQLQKTEDVLSKLQEQDPEVRRLGQYARDEIERNHFSQMFAEIATRRI